MTLPLDGLQRRTWKDFKAGQGGGVLALLPRRSDRGESSQTEL